MLCGVATKGGRKVENMKPIPNPNANAHLMGWTTRADLWRYISDHLSAAGVHDDDDIQAAIVAADEWHAEHGVKWEQYCSHWADCALEAATNEVSERWAR